MGTRASSPLAVAPVAVAAGRVANNDELGAELVAAGAELAANLVGAAAGALWAAFRVFGDPTAVKALSKSAGAAVKALSSVASAVQAAGDDFDKVQMSREMVTDSGPVLSGHLFICLHHLRTGAHVNH